MFFVHYASVSYIFVDSSCKVQLDCDVESKPQDKDSNDNQLAENVYNLTFYLSILTYCS